MQPCLPPCPNRRQLLGSGRCVRCCGCGLFRLASSGTRSGTRSGLGARVAGAHAAGEHVLPRVLSGVRRRNGFLQARAVRGRRRNGCAPFVRDGRQAPFITVAPIFAPPPAPPLSLVVPFLFFTPLGQGRFSPLTTRVISRVCEAGMGAAHRVVGATCCRPYV